MKTILKTEVEIDQKVETLFFQSFKKDVEYCVQHNAYEWKNPTEITGTLFKHVEKSDDAEDNVAIPIENQDGEDGGHVAVWGWKVLTVKTMLEKLEKVKIDKKTETLFSECFNEEVEACVEHDPYAWRNATEITGTLCENIEESDDSDDHVSIPIEDQDGEDGGSVDVNGWKVIA